MSSVLQVHMKLVIDLVKHGKSFERSHFLSVILDILIDTYVVLSFKALLGKS